MFIRFTFKHFGIKHLKTNLKKGYYGYEKIENQKK
jgi:hypothetical protein